MWQFHYPDQQMIHLKDLVEWHHYPSHAIAQGPLQIFEWIIIIVHCCLLVWLTYVRFLERVNNGFLRYNIPYDTKCFIAWKILIFWSGLLLSIAVILLEMGFEALYYILVHWLKNRRCIWRQENQVGVRFMISGWAGQFSIRRATFLLWARKDESSFLTHSSNKTPVIQTFFLRSVSAGKLICIFKALWLFGLANHKHFQPFPSCTSSCHACQSYFTVLASRTLFFR